MQTPSKINLFLRVTGRRPDGYHELQTLFFPLNTPSDEVEIARTDAEGIAFESDDPALPCDGTNLCVKALQRFCEAAGIAPSGYRITLTKRIPVAAGMGGGSSDAAAVLRLMKNLFPDKVSDIRLSEFAAKIGADVPFFLDPRPKLATGIGEKLTPVDGLPEKLPILIAAPHFPVSAKWAYQHRIAENDGRTGSVDELISALRESDFARAANCLKNDLEAAVIRKFPVLQMIREEFLRLKACRVLVTGSGPTMFAMFRNSSARDEAEKEFDRHLPVELIRPDQVISPE